jgi:hypothetical protein
MDKGRFFSGEALSIGGRTPFPVNVENQSFLLAPPS